MQSQFLIHTWTFLAIICVASQLFLSLFWISLWLKNRCLQHPCFCVKLLKPPKNSNSKAQHFLSNLFTHSWFHSMLFALPSYQFPYIVMNRCLYLTGIQNGHMAHRTSHERWFAFAMSSKHGRRAHALAREFHQIPKSDDLKCDDFQ